MTAQGFEDLGERLTKRMDEGFATLSARITAVEKRLARVEMRLDGVEMRLDKLEMRVESLERRLDALIDDVQEIREKLKKY